MVDVHEETESAVTDAAADLDTDLDADTATDGPRLASEVGEDVARAAWADSAREVFLVAAQEYRAVVTQRDLAGAVQERSGITTTQRAHVWVGDVLALVAKDCAARGEPNLASLCVDAAGSVGGGYAAALVASTGDDTVDADRHAAAARLECYQHFGATDLPEDGGRAALTPKLEASRARNRKAAVAARPINMCPVCFMSIPPNGVCVNCE